MITLFLFSMVFLIPYLMIKVFIEMIKLVFYLISLLFDL